MEKERETLKILIVDDSEIDIDILEEILKQLGFQNIIKAKSGKEAVELAAKHLPDLIFLDIMMPGLDGGGVKERLNENAETRDIPTIFISSIIKRKEQRRLGELTGGRILLAKPFSPDDISKTIDIVLGKTPDS